jgi:hypothetical protein
VVASLSGNLPVRDSETENSGITVTGYIVTGYQFADDLPPQTFQSAAPSATSTPASLSTAQASAGNTPQGIAAQATASSNPPHTSAASASKGLGTGGKVGITIGVVLLVVIAVVLLAGLHIKRRRNQQQGGGGSRGEKGILEISRAPLDEKNGKTPQLKQHPMMDGLQTVLAPDILGSFETPAHPGTRIHIDPGPHEMLADEKYEMDAGHAKEMSLRDTKRRMADKREEEIWQSKGKSGRESMDRPTRPLGRLPPPPRNTSIGKTSLNATPPKIDRKPINTSVPRNPEVRIIDSPVELNTPISSLGRGRTPSQSTTTRNHEPPTPVSSMGDLRSQHSNTTPISRNGRTTPVSSIGDLISNGRSTPDYHGTIRDLEAQSRNTSHGRNTPDTRHDRDRERYDRDHVSQGRNTPDPFRNASGRGTPISRNTSVGDMMGGRITPMGVRDQRLEVRDRCVSPISTAERSFLDLSDPED